MFDLNLIFMDQFVFVFYEFYEYCFVRNHTYGLYKLSVMFS